MAIDLNYKYRNYRGILGINFECRVKGNVKAYFVENLIPHGKEKRTKLHRRLE